MQLRRRLWLKDLEYKGSQHSSFSSKISHKEDTKVFNLSELKFLPFFCRNGVKSEYTGEQTKDGIVSWVNRRSSRALNLDEAPFC